MWYWQSSGFYKRFKFPVSFILRILKILLLFPRTPVTFQNAYSFADIIAGESRAYFNLQHYSAKTWVIWANSIFLPFSFLECSLLQLLFSTIPLSVSPNKQVSMFLLGKPSFIGNPGKIIMITAFHKIVTCLGVWCPCSQRLSNFLQKHGFVHFVWFVNSFLF